MSLVQDVDVKDDLVGWKLDRVISVMNRDFALDNNMRYLQRAVGHYIVGKKLHSAQKELQEGMAHPGRYQKIRRNLHVKEVTVGDDSARKDTS